MSKTIETEVREALIKRTAEETFQLFQTPEWKEKTNQFLKTMFSTVSTQLKEELDEDIDSVDDFLFEVKRDVLKPGHLRKNAFETAKRRWQTKEETEVMLINMYKVLKKTGEFGEDALSEFKKQLYPALEFYAQQDRVVNILTDIAKREGLDRATTKEAEYRAIRMIFPTVEKYLRFIKREEDAYKKISSGVQKAFAMDGEFGKYMGVIFAGVTQGIEQIAEEIKEEWTKKQIKEIYNV
jgi:hypothetical protein